MLVMTVGSQLRYLQTAVSCKYDLDEVGLAMAYLQRVSEPGDIVFTDDWDVFPVYFYHNHYNHYIVGLDPKFSHEADPVLWERYVKLSRGQFPAKKTVTYTDEDGDTVRETIHVRIEDIVDYFGANYVITDRDHEPLARKLEKAPRYAERIWPAGPIDDRPTSPYKIFRLFKPDGPPAAEPTTAPVGDS
jgi:hypothetical protein